jgi:hypothetical protein
LRKFACPGKDHAQIAEVSCVFWQQVRGAFDCLDAFGGALQLVQNDAKVVHCVSVIWIDRKRASVSRFGLGEATAPLQ